jgi:non-ribosomal peptide synthetase component E (peptide arylation enzyme)
LLADYKVPDRIIVENSLPLTSMMKVDKRSLADRAASLPPVPRGRGATREPARHR